MSVLHDDFHAHAWPVAVATARRYPRWVETDDCFQELIIYGLRNAAEVNELIEPPVSGEYDDEGELIPVPVKEVRAAHRRLNRRLAKAGERYARKIKAQVAGYETQDEYFYTHNMLETVLPLVFSGETDAALLVNASGHVNAKRSRAVPSEGNNLAAILADVSTALSQLPDDTYRTLEAVFTPGRDTTYQRLDWLADHEGVSRWAIDGRLNRALSRLVNLLGGYAPYERRENVSSARARSDVSRDWDG